MIKEISLYGTVKESIKSYLKNKNVNNTNKIFQGLAVYTSFINSKEIMVGRLPNNKIIYFHCSKVGSKPYPACTSRLEYNKNILVKITFPRSLLTDWVKLATGILDRVETFKIK